MISEFDLVLNRTINAPRALVWAALTEAEQLKKWWCPRPWFIPECRIDLRPGGEFFAQMRGPEGEQHLVHGTYLEIVPQQRLVFTDCLLAGWRPAAEPFFTGIIDLKDAPGGTSYTATARHKDAAVQKQHEEMGFHEGWGKAADQLNEMLN